MCDEGIFKTAEKNLVEATKFFFGKGCRAGIKGHKIFKLYLKNGNVDMIKYLVEKMDVKFSYKLFTESLIHTNPQIMTYL